MITITVNESTNTRDMISHTADKASLMATSDGQCS